MDHHSIICALSVIWMLKLGGVAGNMLAVIPRLLNCSICYYPALSVKNRNRLLKISHVSAKTIGLPTPKLSKIIDHAILKKARAVATMSDQ